MPDSLPPRATTLDQITTLDDFALGVHYARQRIVETHGTVLRLDAASEQEAAATARQVRIALPEAYVSVLRRINAPDGTVAWHVEIRQWNVPPVPHDAEAYADEWTRRHPHGGSSSVRINEDALETMDGFSLGLRCAQQAHGEQHGADTWMGADDDADAVAGAQRLLADHPGAICYVRRDTAPILQDIPWSIVLHCPEERPWPRPSTEYEAAWTARATTVD